MSTNQMHTVSHFFNLHGGSSAWVSQLVHSQQFAPIKQQMARQMRGFPAPPAFDELVVRQLGDLLDVELSDVIVAAWRKRQEIIQYRDTEKYAPGEVHIVPLLEHTLTSRHSPAIQPIFNNVPLPEIKFDVILRLELKGMMFKIVDAMIKEILVGACQGNGSIEYAGLALLKRDTAPYSFPGSVVLKKGIAI